ncbi:MAG TPA: hypothetical protein VK997_08500 [Deferrisomatales bacterium]|nr:hypothetical protein [Deferrisomatales bacterium]
MAQIRYLAAAYRQIGSAESRVWQTVQGNPRATQAWRRVAVRVDELTADGMPADPDVIADDPLIKALAEEIRVVLIC